MEVNGCNLQLFLEFEFDAHEFIFEHINLLGHLLLEAVVVELLALLDRVELPELVLALRLELVYRHDRLLLRLLLSVAQHLLAVSCRVHLFFVTVFHFSLELGGELVDVLVEGLERLDELGQTAEDRALLVVLDDAGDHADGAVDLGVAQGRVRRQLQVVRRRPRLVQHRLLLVHVLTMLLHSVGPRLLIYQLVV